MLQVSQPMLKRVAWCVGALACAVVGYLSFSGALQMVWRSAFTHANVEQLRLWFFGYVGLLLLAIVGVVLCVRRAIHTRTKRISDSPLSG